MSAEGAAVAAGIGFGGEAYQLGPAQRLWTNAPRCVRGLVLRFDRPLDSGRLSRALVATGEAFEALRTRFPARPGFTVPLQQIDPAQPAWLETAVLDPGRSPVVAATLGDGGSELSLSALPAALDRRGLLLWARALGLAYGGEALGDTIQPADAAEGLAALAAEAVTEPAHDFWRKALDESQMPGRLPEESAAGDGTGRILDWRWDAAAPQPTPASALALWWSWLCRETGLARVTIGVELSGRDSDLDDAVGCYARYAPCTLAADRAASLAAAALSAGEWLERAQRWMLVAPDPVGPATDRTGALDSFAYGFSDRTDDPAVDWASSVVWREQAEPPCRLALNLLPGGFQLVFDSARFTAEDAAMLASRFAHFAAEAAADPERPFVRLARMPSSSAVQILARGKGPPLAARAAGTVLDLIGAVAADRPGQRALSDPGEGATYTAFWDGAGRIAARLAAEGVGRGDRVAIVAPPAASTIVAMIAILRAGAVAVPIDPAFPESRQAMLVDDVGATLALVDPGREDRQAALGCPALAIDAALDGAGPPAPAPPAPEGKDGAYIIHTSGSTGRPKGVLVSHSSLLASTRARLAYYAEAPARFLLTPSLSFDSSVAGLYWTLATGGELLLPAPGEARDPGALARLIARSRPSHWLTVPALYQAVLTAAGQGELDSLTDAIVAGEACPPGLLAAHAAKAPNARLHNEYGPTEATVWCTCWSWTPGDRLPDAVPIGKPVPGAAVYILDPQGEPVPDGAAGEIHIGGPGVAVGYAGRPAATAAAFRPDPFDDAGGARLYASGDLGRRRSDGTIVHVGRTDRQLKIGGRRIEPGEIEMQLDALAGVARSAVLMRGGHMVAYVEREPGARVDGEGLRLGLAAKLPQWLVPERIVVLDSFPTGPTGKLDQDALPDPAEMLRPPYRAPVEPAARALAEAVGEVVGVADPGLDDDFFALGGDSLMALQVAARLRGAGFALSVRSIFATPKLGALAALALPVAAERGPDAADEAPAPLTPIQRWFLARDLPQPRHYNQAVAFEAGERLVPDRLEAALGRVMANHPALRSKIDPSGKQTVLADAPPAPGWFDLRAVPAGLKERLLAQKVAELQQGLDPFEGRMLRAAVFRLAADRPDLLVLAVHHLAIDARSWQILAEDLAAAYRGRPLAPALSFGQWAKALAGEDPSREEQAWAAYLAGADGRLPRDRSGGANREADAVEMEVVLAPALVRALARWSGGRPGRALSDSILATLAVAVGDWTGHEMLLLDVEGSGRDVAAHLPDPSRTIGWLTTLAPLALPRRPGEALEARLRAAAAAVDAAPPDWTYALGSKSGPSPGAELCVNFLGGMTDDSIVGGLLRPVPVDLGPARGPDNPRAHLVDLEAETGADGLRLRWRYPAPAFEAATIRRVAERHRDLLAGLAG